MKKLRLDALKVDTFATTAPAPPVRGTVAAHHQSTQCTDPYCYVSWDGTCYFTCFDTCACDTSIQVCG
jgi:hypothetical protein